MCVCGIGDVRDCRRRHIFHFDFSPIEFEMYWKTVDVTVLI